MVGPQAQAASVQGSGPDDALPGAVTDLDRHRIARANGSERQLQCVSSGYLAGGCACRSTIPMDAVTAAWQGVLERGEASADGFFRFAWHDGVWLAFGLRDGRVRGVYCPAHSAERDERAHAADVGDVARAQVLPISA